MCIEFSDTENPLFMFDFYLVGSFFMESLFLLDLMLSLFILYYDLKYSPFLYMQGMDSSVSFENDAVPRIIELTRPSPWLREVGRKIEISGHNINMIILEGWIL